MFTRLGVNYKRETGEDGIDASEVYYYYDYYDEDNDIDYFDVES